MDWLFGPAPMWSVLLIVVVEVLLLLSIKGDSVHVRARADEIANRPSSWQDLVALGGTMLLSKLAASTPPPSGLAPLNGGAASPAPDNKVKQDAPPPQ